MVAFGNILIVFVTILSCLYDHAYSVNGITITDVGDLNFEVSWIPAENYSGMYNLTRDFGERNLCYTNATSCFLGGKLLEDEPCPLIQMLLVTLFANDTQLQSAFILNYGFRVGAPNILSSDVDSTNITIVVQGAQTPLYFDRDERKCRGESWQGEKSPIYMGQSASKHGVTCYYNLTDSAGSSASHEKMNIYGWELSEITGKLHIILSKLKAFSNYTIAIWCRLNDVDGPSTVYNFATKEDVPSSGPTIEKSSSEGLGCERPDSRNITFSIQPPPEDQRHGILKFYEICYRVVTTNQDEEWQSEILELPSPPPAVTEVTLEDISRWDAYEVKVFANNSVGGMSSSVHQFDVLKSALLQSRPENLTKEIKEGNWFLKWDHPWSPHTGDCIINYAISHKDRVLGTTNTTSYKIDTKAVGKVYEVKVTPMIYNGTGPAFKGFELSTVLTKTKPEETSALIPTLSVLLSVFIILLIGCTYVCVEHGPRWTQPFDISNNSVLKAASAMGDFRPRIPEREEFDTLVGIPPPPPPPPADDDSEDDEMEAIALIETPPAGRAGGDAVPRPPIPDQSPPHSTAGSLSEECDQMVAMVNDAENPPVAFSSSSSVNYDSSGVMGLQSLQPSGSNLNTSCSEDSLGPPRYPSPTDSGYVQSPPPKPISNQAKPAEDSGYFRFDAITNIPCRVVIDNGKHHPGGDTNERSCDDTAMSSFLKYTDSGYVAGTMTPMSSASTYPETTPLQGKYYMMKAIRKQSSIDSADTTTSGSLSPSDSEMGDGMGSYTKLSHPNTPLSPRSNGKPGEELQAGWDLEKDLNSIQSLLHQLNDQVQPSGLSNVG